MQFRFPIFCGDRKIAPRMVRPLQFAARPEVLRSGVTLLRLLHLCELALPTTLGGLGARLGVEEVVPPPEAARVVANEAFVMYVMVVSAGPEREEVVQAPWELITAMRVDGLEQTEDNPDIHGQDMEVLGDGTPKNW